MHASNECDARRPIVVVARAARTKYRDAMFNIWSACVSDGCGNQAIRSRTMMRMMFARRQARATSSAKCTACIHDQHRCYRIIYWLGNGTQQRNNVEQHAQAHQSTLPPDKIDVAGQCVNNCWRTSDQRKAAWCEHNVRHSRL